MASVFRKCTQAVVGGRLLQRLNIICQSSRNNSTETPEHESSVCVYNEWDPLEEVIVGRPEGARVPFANPEVKAILRPEFWDWFVENGGKAYDPEVVEKAVDEVNEFCRVLEGEGVKVHRPELINWTEKGTFKTPDFEEGGFAMACPRDSITVIGDEILEAAMPWRCRYFETRPYRGILNELFKRGARWTQAPKPTMRKELYREDYPFLDAEKRMEMTKRGEYVITEVEPCFDAAEIMRCGKDIFAQRSHTLNKAGLQWLKRHFGKQGYRVHALNTHDSYALHADATFFTMRPGLAIANPTRPCMQTELFKKAGWEVLEAPHPTPFEGDLVYSSGWLSMNVLMLDEKRLIIFDKEPKLKAFFKDLGFTCIGVDMSNAFPLGGAFHCWTTDIKRKGTLQSYGFDNIDFDSIEY